MRTFLTYVLAALAAATMTVGMLTGLSPEAWQIERLPDRALLWFGVWAVAGSLIWFVIASGARHFLNWGNRTWWTIFRGSAAFAVVAFLVAVPVLGFDVAEHARSFEYPERQEWFWYVLNAVYPGLYLALFAAIAGAIWGTVFWLREPKTTQAMEVAA
ncbi:MAG: hypothetical protein GC208_02255 [Alphaproteobacteria bacterium]|nr:hypothetical protein [Alphaproteobacteria bacterium]